MRRRGRLLWLAAGLSVVALVIAWWNFWAPWAGGRIVIEVSPDCGAALSDSSPTRQLELSLTEPGSLNILLRDSNGTDTNASLDYYDLGFKGGWAWDAGMACPGWVWHRIWREDETFVRCAPLRADGTVALIDREDGRIEEVRVPVSESRVVDLGDGHRVRIFGFANVGLTVENRRVGGIDKSRVFWNGGWLPNDTAEVPVRWDERTYCAFLDIATGPPRYLDVLITK